jgi:hypothetical protein
MPKKSLKRISFLVTILAMSVLPFSSWTAEVTKEQVKGLDEQVQDIKEDVLGLATELSLLEEKLLFPSNTQVSLFVSLDSGEAFTLDAMQIKLDDKVVAKYLYTFKELEALRLGGVQRIYTGNISAGDHPLEASFIARSASGNQFQGSANFIVNKAVGPRFVEIRITGGNSADQTISFQDW